MAIFGRKNLNIRFQLKIFYFKIYTRINRIIKTLAMNRFDLDFNRFFFYLPYLNSNLQRAQKLGLALFIAAILFRNTSIVSTVVSIIRLSIIKSNKIFFNSLKKFSEIVYLVFYLTNLL